MREVETTLLNHQDALDLASLTRQQAANLCGVSLTTFDKWWREHGLPYYVLPGLDNRRRFNFVEIKEWQQKYRSVCEPKKIQRGIRKMG